MKTITFNSITPSNYHNLGEFVLNQILNTLLNTTDCTAPVTCSEGLTVRVDYLITDNLGNIAPALRWEY